MTATALALADTARLEGLAFHFSDDCTPFDLADTIRFEGLAFYFGDDSYGLRPCRQLGSRGPPSTSATTATAFALCQCLLPSLLRDTLSSKVCK